MKKKCITASVIMITIALLINMLGFHIYADMTYFQMYQNQCSIAYEYDAQPYFIYKAYMTSQDTRRVVFITGTNYYGYTIGLSQFTQRYSGGTSSGNACEILSNGGGTSTNVIQYTYNNVEYWSTNSSNDKGFYTDATSIIQNVPTIDLNGTEYQNYTDRQRKDLAYRYTYGDLADNTVINYGELEISYQQNIITDGNGALNEDIIRWNAYRDTAGNDLQGKNIEIQAIAGYFQGSSYADLKANNFTDWLNATHPAVTMYKGSIEKSYEVYEWGEVATNFRDINTLGMWFWNIFTSEETWYQYGWRYQARILDEELEPLTEWQLIYTGNSWTPSATETFTDDEPLNPDDVETINDINDENGNDVNWYINNTYITNNEYNQTYQQNIIENIYNILQGQPDDGLNNKAHDVQQTIDNAIDTEDNYMNDLQTQLTDLELNDITTNNGLMKALRWVREVHHETIEETEIGGIVLTIMLIGLITYLIGRRNG